MRHPDAGFRDSSLSIAVLSALADRLSLNNVADVAKPPSNSLIELSGGPGRTRTCNQTVMSGRL